MKVRTMNIGLTKAVLKKLDEKTARFYGELLADMREEFPLITSNQLAGTLASLERYGKVLHIARGAWACLDYPNR